MKPVIDIHCHVFSGKDIPLEGYLLSRTFEKWLAKTFAPLLIPAIANCIRNKFKLDKKFFSRLKCKATMSLLKSLEGQGYVDWGETLSQDVKTITAEMVEAFQHDDVALYVPLMIDYEYWFINSLDHPIRQQIEYIYKNIIPAYQGMLHPFVAFDPARELAFRQGLTNPDGLPEAVGSLQLVKDAIENKGFIGVKLYNAMGYRPWNNAAVEEQRKHIPMHDEKYVFNGQAYDEVLGELYDYCIEKEVPITTHCGMYGSESYPDASFDFGKAIYWRDVLDQDRFQHLHLNLAHFGWYRKEGYEGDITWVKDICEMLNDYEFLYTDVAHHYIIKKKETDQFKIEYEKILADFPIVKTRLLYGTDWHVLKRVKNFRQFKQKYLEIFRHKDLLDNAELENFFSNNALEFLGMYDGSQSVQRLEIFYQTHNIIPPKWFTDIKK